MRRPLVALVVVAAVAAACTASPRGAAPNPSPTARPLVYVAVGASESVGVGASDPLRNAWTQLFYRSALPASTVFVNMAVPGSTTAQALTDQVPPAVGQSPDVVTVWLAVNDLLHAVPVATYQAELTQLVTALRRGGATKVLVANMPPLDDLPAYQACLTGTSACFLGPGGAPVTVPPASTVAAAVAAYNAAIAQVVASTGAIPVDLHAVALAARQNGTEASLVSSDGFHPSDAGHALVAKAFAAAYKASGGH